MIKFPFIKQRDAMDCGPACLAMVAKYYGKTYSLQRLRETSFITREGVSLLGISDAAEAIGMRTTGVKITYEQLADEAKLPCIAHWKQTHFIVVYKIKKGKVYVVDPGFGRITYTEDEFKNNWLSTKSSIDFNGVENSSDSKIDNDIFAELLKTKASELAKSSEDEKTQASKKELFDKLIASQKETKEEQMEQKEGICLILEPAPDFYRMEDEDLDKTKFKFLFSYLRPYKKLVLQLILGLGAGSGLQLIFPFLTQSLVDKGIGNRNIDFVYLILIAQLVLFVSQTGIEFIRSWILLHISTRINISLISDFLIKLLKLPIGYFDSKMIGDIMQRIQDHKRIENFLTSSTLNIIFSMMTLIIFGLVLAYYMMEIFFIFLIGSTLYLLWVYLFMKQRRKLDFKRFAQLSNNQSNLIQLVQGIQEIKLNNCEKIKRWEWERIQARLFKVNIKSLALSQYQQSGSVFIDQVKNIIISFFSAKAVIDGDMTLGTLMAVQYIIGQLNSPINQMIGFFQSTQDAKISLERLGEIHLKKDEESSDDIRINDIPENKSIAISNLSFQYEGPHSEYVLKDLNLTIPDGKVTAIVGVSGSGKTTLIKLLLGFYKPTKGEIAIGGSQLDKINQKIWRANCGVVMQDGFIFSDTIAKNIAITEENYSREQLHYAVNVANIREFIESLPLNYYTKIGMEGTGLSQGQKQRILIARCVYKNPEFIFFDEATNALDANNERTIMDNLNKFFSGKTAVIVAHRLSTVKNADQIVVLDNGKIVEKGTHQELTQLKGHYYKLVKNQLELGN